jgi:bacterioferritin-associated ferredoxin
MYVCSCHAIAEDVVCAAIDAGATSVDEVNERCGTGDDCGSCRVLIEELLAGVLHNHVPLTTGVA